MTVTITDTDRVLASMMVENTGRHFLDSGGAYGRAWEHNQAKYGTEDPVRALIETPDAWIDGWPTVSVFHFLRARLDYAPDMDRRWRMWCYAGGGKNRWDKGYRFLNSYGTLEEFWQALVDKGWAKKHGEWSGTGGLTYNSENVMSQDFHYFFMDTTEASPWGVDSFVFINLHNGADIRGGYTDFRAFRGDPYNLLDFGDVDISWRCDACQAKKPDPNQQQLIDADQYGRSPEPGIWWGTIRAGYPEIYDSTSYEVDYSKDVIEAMTDFYDGPKCPTCGGELHAEAHAPYPSC